MTLPMDRDGQWTLFMDVGQLAKESGQADMNIWLKTLKMDNGQFVMNTQQGLIQKRHTEDKPGEAVFFFRPN